jgi:apolipoprotein N-acyltransferase
VGLAFGLGLHAHGHAWLWGALTTHAQAGVSWALLGTAGAMVYLALYHALAAAVAGGLACLISPRGAVSGAGAGTYAGLWLGACCTAAEWLRSLPWSGMGGLSLGYAVLDTPALGWLPLVGVYGVSASVWAVSVALAAAVSARQRPAAWLALCGVAGCLWGGGALALHATWTVPVPTERPWRFHLLGAPAAPRQQEWLARLEAVSADLVLTPETAMPTSYAQWGPDTTTRLWAHSQRTGGHLLVGTLAEGPGGLYNSVLVWGPPGVVGRYNKRALTPVGEHTPDGLGWYARGLRIPDNGLQPGVDATALWLRGRRGVLPVGFWVCQEDMRIGWALDQLPAATVWLNPGNLGWFDSPWARALRLQAARARAAETGRPVLRAETGGTTAHIDHQGRVVAAAPGPVGADLQGVVQPHTGTTPYVRWSLWWHGL